MRVPVTAAPFAVPRDCSLLVFPSLYHRDRHARLGGTADFQPEERCYRLEIPLHGVVEIRKLWPARTGFALVTAAGSVLATTFVDIVSDSNQLVELRPASPLSARDVANDGMAAARFAILSHQRGMVLRGAIGASSTTRYLSPPGRYRWRRLPGETHALNRNRAAQKSELVLEPGDSTILHLR